VRFESARTARLPDDKNSKVPPGRAGHAQRASVNERGCAFSVTARSARCSGKCSGKCSAFNPLIPARSDRSDFLTIQPLLTDHDNRVAQQTMPKPQCLREACTGLSRRPPLVVQVVMVLRFFAVVMCLRRETPLPECPQRCEMCVQPMERIFCAQVFRSDEH
jgi:hypothetical protein